MGGGNWRSEAREEGVWNSPFGEQRSNLIKTWVRRLHDAIRGHELKVRPVCMACAFLKIHSAAQVPVQRRQKAGAEFAFFLPII